MRTWLAALDEFRTWWLGGPPPLLRSYGETSRRSAPGFHARGGGWLGLPALLSFSLCGSTAALAQEPSSSSPLLPPVTLAYVDGRAEIARATGVDAATAPDVLEAGDRLLNRDGRAELVYADGSVVHVDRDGDVRIDDDVRLYVTRGRVALRTSAASDAIDVATPAGVVRLEPRGEYLIEARDLDGETRVATIAGRATLALARTAADLPISPDDEVAIDPRGGEPRWSRVGRRADAFTDWAALRMNEADQARGRQPLPAELYAYAPWFQRYGRWDTLPTYGPVWYPTVAPGWRPYLNGSWRYTRYGWTWIDRDPWGWPVHHYGRWGRHPSRGWYWMPQRTWGPAWVGWAVQADYVGWAPLGWNSRPVVDFFAGARVGPLDIRAGTWSLLPRRSFGVRGPIGPYLMDPRRLPGPVLGGFVVHTDSPRGPRDWGRRGATAPAGYGRAIAPARPSRTYGEARPRTSAPREAVPRAQRAPVPADRSTARPASPMRRPMDAPAAPAGVAVPSDTRPTSDPRTWRAPGRDTRVVAPRPSDAGRATESAGERAASPQPSERRARRPVDGAAYGRPTQADGGGIVRREPARDSAGQRGRRDGGQAVERGGASGDRGAVRARGDRTDSPRGDGGGRRRPR